MSLPAVPEILARTEGRVGRITLNRPKALNALTEPMCLAVSQALLAWQDDPAVDLVLIDHAGERGFCAGGDIRMMAEFGRAAPDAGAAFFLAEYRMNALLQRYPKPVAAVMDGITMGGGVGLSVYARHRIATERTLFAMPETGIGLFPDVGMGWVLSRLPGEVGTFLALAGARIRAADLLYQGLCDHHVESARLEALKAELVARPQAAAEIIAGFESDPGPAPLAGRQVEIDALFAGASAERILERLHVGSDWAREQAAVLAAKSPSSVKVALRQLRLAAEKPSFVDEIALEYRLACRLISTPDFQEGVRAVVLDKDNAPRWRPARLEDVTDDALAALFAPFDDRPEFSAL